MKYLSKMVVMQECPGEVALSFLITGCGLKCKGCHSEQAWSGTIGTELSPALLAEEIDKQQGLISTVLFLGGEWEPENLAELLDVVKEKGFKSCLYTGLEFKAVPQLLLAKLDLLKVGRWVQELGPLESETTNQRYYSMPDKTDLTYKFRQGTD